MIDYQVVLIQFPSGKTHEAITENEDGSFTIFIDASLAREAQKERFRHAYKHITGHDFYGFDVDNIELRCHNMETSSELCLALMT